MREVLLELTDRDGTPVRFLARSDGRFDVDWDNTKPTLNPATAWDWRSERPSWLKETYSAPLVPVIDAAFAALKEEADDR